MKIIRKKSVLLHIILFTLIVINIGFYINVKIQYNALFNANQVRPLKGNLKSKFKDIRNVTVENLDGDVALSVLVNKNLSVEKALGIFNYARPILESQQLKMQKTNNKDSIDNIYLKYNEFLCSFDRFYLSSQDNIWRYSFDSKWHSPKSHKVFYEDTGVLLENIFNNNGKINFDEVGKKAYYSYSKDSNRLIYSIYSNVDGGGLTGTKNQMFINEFIVNKNDESKAIFSNSMKFSISLPLSDEDIKLVDSKGLKVLSDETINIADEGSSFTRKNFDFQFNDAKDVTNSYAKFTIISKTGQSYDILIKL